MPLRVFLSTTLISTSELNRLLHGYTRSCVDCMHWIYLSAGGVTYSMTHDYHLTHTATTITPRLRRIIRSTYRIIFRRNRPLLPRKHFRGGLHDAENGGESCELTLEA